MEQNDQEIERQADDYSDLPIFVKWLDYLKWLVATVEKFPKKVRFTLVDRIINLALDVLELLIEARFSRQKLPLLRKANLDLEKIRILLRLAFEFRFLPQRQYGHSMKAINEVGRMLGGWIKQQQAGTK
jgi:hypothetical protein